MTDFHFRGSFPRAGERALLIDARRLVGGADRGDNIVISIEDVTERERVQRTSRQQSELLDLAHDAIVVSELRGPIRYWNRGAQELYGWSAQDAIGKSADALLRTLRDVEYAAVEQALLQTGRWSGEQTQTTNDGRRIVVEAVFSLLEQPDGVQLVLESSRDITERKKVVEELRLQDRRKNEFLAMLGHELRNPLAPMTNALALLRQASDEREIARLHDMIERQTQMLARIVDDLLDVARVTQGRIELRRYHADLRELADHAIDAMREQFTARAQRIDFDRPRRPIEANVDPTRVEQVMVNLLSNASRYSPVGSPVRFELDMVDSQAVIRVRDDGIGIPADMLKHVFEPFVQLDRGATARVGLGIGLTLVQRVVALHGGSVEARSAGLGHGSEFIVRLPLGADDVVAPPPDAQPPPATTVRRRVLIVDDNADSCDSVADLVRSWGHDAATAHDATAALATAPTFEPDVVLLDIGLPDIDGYELAHRLRKLRGLSRALIIAMTGYGAADDRKASRDAGIDEHLVKPIDLKTLQRLLVRLPDPAP